MSKILLLNGPNLNMLGLRNRQQYGSVSLGVIESGLIERAQLSGVDLLCLQSNHEGELIDFLQLHFPKGGDGRAEIRGIIINPGGLSHTSVSLRDALELYSEHEIPIVEVHLSNIYGRESFRHHSYISEIASVVLSGCQADGYTFALQYLLQNSAGTRGDSDGSSQ